VLANASVTEAKLAFDPATQVELDAATATAATADVTLQTNINTASDALTTYKTLLSNSGGTANAATNPLSWSQLKDIPPEVTSGGGVSSISGWERVIETFAIPALTSGITTITALCPAGKKAIGGGYESPLSGVTVFFQPLNIVATRPNSDGTGWEVLVWYPGTHGAAPGTAYAVCANAAL
jgi:hypothetical protein